MAIGFLFPGQGSQFTGMGEEFYREFPQVREIFGEASERVKVDFPKLMFEENEKLNQTRYTQPAILLFSGTIFKLLEGEKGELNWGYGIGHSLGEFTGLTAGGGLDLIDGVELVKRRGELMEEAFQTGEPGSMMVVLGLPDEKVEEICQNSGLKIYPANYNSDGQLVVAGLRSHLQKAEPLFKEAGAKRVMLLNMSVASHCPLLEPAVEPLRQMLTQFLNPTFKPMVSNVTAQPYSTKGEGLELLPIQLTKPVRYKESIKNIDDKIDFYVEVGGKVLMGLNRRLTKKRTYPITDLKSFQKVLDLL
ncbi:MAG: [acyl-carrier-protein] S-malonyltransferase [Epsilonproteobacteria bacterium]|nr:[acyl-carrier-protein] S-malonyltransferase [Campylobacterota bacterium]NPA89720.1 ACP S-malonyltransferase [Campylobacterota bacterium]